MYCPECGHDAGNAKFCPECGTGLSHVKGARSGDAKSAKSTTAQSGSGSTAVPGKLSPAVVWGVLIAVAIVAVVVVIMVSGGGSDKAASGDSASGSEVSHVDADTSGSYDKLVQRANDLYDKGQEDFRNQPEQAAEYFAEAAEVYAAAWKKQATDPNVGVDYAVSLFYSGDIDAAIAQVDAVLAKNPDHQQGWFNKGIILSHAARVAEQDDAKKGAEMLQQAKTALSKAVEIDPKSDSGKAAAESLKSLK